MAILFGIIQIVGSLGLFLFGMKLMSDGLQNSAGERLQKILAHMTTNRFTSLLTGLGITSIIQSSSATTVFVVSFVNAGLLTLQQAIGVIMGANIGTTVTAWIVSIFGFQFDIVKMAIPAIAIGLPFIFMRSAGKKAIGETFIGFGLLFMGLMYLKDSVPDIADYPEILRWIAGLAQGGILSTLLFVFIGTFVTVIVQSSSAAMAITLTMANAGWIDFPTAAALCLGENIGTTITAQLAAFSQNTTAKQAAMAHTMFNVIGVAWLLLVFPFFLRFVDLIIPGSASDPTAIPTHLSMFHTAFNIVNSFLFIWFVPAYTKFIERMVPGKAEDTEVYRLKYVNAGLQDTPEINILTAKTELEKMSQKVLTMYRHLLFTLSKTKRPEKKDFEPVYKNEDYLDQMQEEISRFVARCMQEKPSDNTAQKLGKMIKVIDNLESIGDSCTSISNLFSRAADKKINLGESHIKDIESFLREVEIFLAFIHEHLNKSLGPDELKEAEIMEKKVNGYRNDLKKAARKRMQHGAPVKVEIVYIDIIEQIELIGDFAMDIAEELKTNERGKIRN